MSSLIYTFVKTKLLIVPQAGCLCNPGWSGWACEIPICDNCSAEHGECVAPGECRCKHVSMHSSITELHCNGHFFSSLQLGWEGEGCNKCSVYPGCLHGYCSDPWQCNCEQVKKECVLFLFPTLLQGWRGMLCDFPTPEE